MTHGQSQTSLAPMTDAKDFPYLDMLNPEQRQAVETIDGPLLVLAGAGTGKTRVLTSRIAHILFQRKALPHQILAVTFTNKAAFEMRERVSKMMGMAVEGLWLGTFHALCVKILRRHAERLGFHTNFTILDVDDQLRLIKQLLKAENVDEKKWPARLVLGQINQWKDRGLNPDQVPAHAKDLSGYGNPAYDLYPQYQERLKTLNALDFGDLLLHALTLFKTCPDVLESYQSQFKYILVDEYQDTNVAQYLWLRLLAMGHHNICCVGDDDQSIYGWRGAEITNILKFEQDFASAVVIRLEQNYRSTNHILGAASGLIAHNAGRLGKTLWTETEGGEKIIIQGLWDGQEEARFVGDEIEHLQKNKSSLSSMAILVRASHQTREFEERLMTLGIPFRVIGGPRFYERMEIRDALADLRIIFEPHDSLAFERIINTPKRGLGAAALQTLHHLARTQNISLYLASHKIIETEELRGAARKALSDFLNDIDRWRGLYERTSPADMARLVLDESGYTAMWLNDKTPEAPGRLENLKEFVLALENFDTLAAFLDHVSLVMENTGPTDLDCVSIMTLHSAKGLEFKHVFLTGWEEGLFPNQRTLEEVGTKGLEEERRLAYVGITRARETLYILYAANRRIHGSWQSSIPSRFIAEIPNNHTDHRRQSGFSSTPYLSESKIRPYISGPTSRPLSPQSTIPSSSALGLQIGDRVFHIKFGYGRIRAIEADKLDINFEHTGLKKVLASFVEKAK
ncbi:MAG: ATP-dependent helicase [Candidatus Nucleicultricaceae bacterium]